MLDVGLLGQHNSSFEFNKKYRIDSLPKWNNIGFHFCTHIEDTLRYRDKRTDEFVIVEVLATGNIVDGSSLENDYYGYETGYATDEIVIVREVSRQEMIDIVLSSRNEDRVTRLIINIPLSEEEIKLILENYKSRRVMQHIEYFQYGDKQAFYRR